MYCIMYSCAKFAAFEKCDQIWNDLECFDKSYWNNKDVNVQLFIISSLIKFLRQSHRQKRVSLMDY